MKMYRRKHQIIVAIVNHVGLHVNYLFLFPVMECLHLLLHSSVSKENKLVRETFVVY